MRIASFTHSLTVTSSPISATRTSPRSSRSMTDRTAVNACDTGITSRQSSPASQSRVMVFSRSSLILLLVRNSGRAVREPVEGELEALARLHEREPDMVGARGPVEVARRDQQAGRGRELGGDLPPVVGAVLLT